MRTTFAQVIRVGAGSRPRLFTGRPRVVHNNTPSRPHRVHIVVHRVGVSLVDGAHQASYGQGVGTPGWGAVHKGKVDGASGPGFRIRGFEPVAVLWKTCGQSRRAATTTACMRAA